MQWKCKHYFFYFAPISEHNNTKYKCLTFNCPRLKFKTLTSHTNKHTMLVAKVSKGRLHLDMWVSLIVWPDGYIQQWKRLPKLYSLPITEGTLDRLPKIFKILPNWWNFDKCGHAALSPKIRIQKCLQDKCVVLRRTVRCDLSKGKQNRWSLTKNFLKLFSLLPEPSTLSSDV